jgi:3-oxoacyl-[acyl-carrier-protein] synthase II
VMAEGAGIIVIEEYEHAKARGANILAEILGYGMSADGTHMTAPCADGSGARYAMEQALRDAKVDRTSIDYVNAHGTSTPLGDKAETLAIKAVFGEHAKTLAISSAKSQLGHLLGASGGVEVVLCVQSLMNQVATPTINLDNPDPDCDLDYVPNQARNMKINRILKNSFGFGGHNACLVLGRV